MKVPRLLRRPGSAAAVLVVLLALAAAAAAAEIRREAVSTVTYAYGNPSAGAALRACGRVFLRTRPGLQLRFRPQPPGTGDYASWLRSGLRSSDPPDAFAIDASGFSALVTEKLLRPLDDIVSRETLAGGHYWRGALRLWHGPDGRQYGLPATVESAALAVHARLARNVVPWSKLANARWGTSIFDWGKFEETLWRLTIDVHGHHGADPGFPRAFRKRRIRVYGLALGTSWADGFDSWSSPIVGAGGSVVDRTSWPRRFNYGDSRLASFLTFWRREITHRYVPPVPNGAAPGSAELFLRRRAVMAVVSSSTAATIARRTGDARFVRLPRVEDGRWIPMRPVEGYGVGAHSEKATQAARLIALFGTGRCATLAGGDQMPATRAGAPVWLAKERRRTGRDLRAFEPRRIGIVTGLVVRDRSALDAAAADVFSRILRGADPARELNQLDARLNQR